MTGSIRLCLRAMIGFVLIVAATGTSAEEAKKKLFLVTSSTGALGMEIAESLAKKGHDIILGGRNSEKLSKLKNNLAARYDVQIGLLNYDFTNQSSVEIAASKLSQQLDGMVIIPPRNVFATKGVPTAKEWRLAIEEGFVGPMEFIKNFMPKLNDNGSTVIISGITSKYYMNEYPNSNVVKLMWSGEVKNLCVQFNESFKRFNVVSPGTTLTAFNMDKIKKRAEDAGLSYEEQLKAETKSLPSKRYAKPVDIANLVTFLLNEESSYINCGNIAIDGGTSKAY